AAMMVGASANVSFRTGQSVLINDLLPGLQRPDLPPMPGHDTALPMPVATTQL
ncbi:MAG: hypothetical protein RL030_2704, partial [Pseudomonadota bacterium]